MPKFGVQKFNNNLIGVMCNMKTKYIIGNTSIVRR